ncbi:MAG: peptidase [Gemmatimonadetes bacterium]|nr:peptidase [Gemmatimonadota bacterium]
MTKRIVALVALALPALLSAQAPSIDYAARRNALLASIDSGVVVAYGVVEPVNYWPNPFQLPAFQYLTGFGETDGVLLITKQGGKTATVLFAPTRNALEQRWNGARTSVADFNRKYGIPGRDISQLRATLDSLAATKLPFYSVPDIQASDYAAEDSLTRGSRLAQELARQGLKPRSLGARVDAMRANKSPAEIELLRKAAQISVRAHVEAMKAVAPQCGENEIQALLDGTFRRFGGDRPAYGSIVGSGPNATTLHYMDDNRVMRAGELLLIDAATSFDHYSADVTRTVPVNGTFSKPQRDIYQIVLDAQAAYVRQVKPGVAESVASDSGRAVATKGLIALGLMESATATFDPPEGMTCDRRDCSQAGLYLPHGYGGHGIGLEVHDPAQYYYTGRFAVGDVTTVEPGIYVDSAFFASLPDTPKNRAMKAKLAPALAKYMGIGVRIEDDYAVTATGVDWLSKGAPREIADVEAMMKQRKPELPGGGSCGSLRM